MPITDDDPWDPWGFIAAAVAGVVGAVALTRWHVMGPGAALAVAAACVAGIGWLWWRGRGEPPD